MYAVGGATAFKGGSGFGKVRVPPLFHSIQIGPTPSAPPVKARLDTELGLAQPGAHGCRVLGVLVEELVGVLVGELLGCHLSYPNMNCMQR